MSTERHDDRILTACGILAVVAAAAVLLTLRHDSPDTTFYSAMAGVRFVLSVGVLIVGTISVIERRVGAPGSPVAAIDEASQDDQVIDLRDGGQVRPSVPATELLRY